MKARITQIITVSSLSCVLAVSCSTSELSPQGTLPAVPPPLVQAPHPGGYGIGDLTAIFTTPGAPKLEELKGCDDEFRKLKESTQAQEERLEGARELVKRDPIKFHWCFYGKILQLENDLKAQNYLDEKQKTVISAYSTLTPIGRAFMQEFHDSRYMRWAVRHYRQISEWVFYRKVELTPQATSELVEAAQPMGLQREPATLVPVLEKYNIAKPAAPAEAPGPTAPGLADAPPVDMIDPPAPRASEAAPPPLPPDGYRAMDNTPPPLPTPERKPASAPTTAPPPEPPAAPGTFESIMRGESAPPVVDVPAPAASPGASK